MILMLVCIMQGAAVFAAFSYAETGAAAADDASAADDDAAIATDDAGAADDGAAIANRDAAALVFADDSRLRYAQLIRYPFLDTKTVAYDWSFPYSDRFFEIPSGEFSMTTAQGSLGLALSAFRSTADTVAPQYKTYLTRAGFHDFFVFGYDKETTEDSLSGIIGMKKVNGSTVIAAVTCGQGYQNEWAGNMKVGKGVRHEGFNTAAKLLEGYLESYISDNGITGSRKLWITGISRAAAVANITAADAVESGAYDDVYAYLFGVPRTTKEPVNYRGIYNICGQYDPVAATPLQSWGYERYGTDIYTPAQESDEAYPYFAERASRVAAEIDGKGFRNNPEVNYQLRLAVEFMDEFFDGSDEYADRFQDLLVGAVKNHQPEEILEILSDAFGRLPPEDRREKASISTFINYLSYIAAQHMRAKQRQVDDGSWDPNEPLAANLMLEHRPSTYVKWMFADADPEELLTAPIRSRRVSVIGKVSVTVYKGDAAVSAIDVKGQVTAPDPDEPEEMSGPNGVFLMRNGEETTISLPADDHYTIEISSRGNTDLSYLEVDVTPEDLVQDHVSIIMGELRNGTIRLRAEPGKELSEPEEVKGSYIQWGVTQYAYTPSVIMHNELDATKGSYLSISSGLRVVRAMLAELLLLAAVCLIIFIIHSSKVARGHPPYSDLYVIVPHIICIITFIVLTQMLSFYMFSIKQARAQCAAVTVLFIALLALRGAIRSRRPLAFAAAAGLFVLVHLTGVYYNRMPIDAFSPAHIIAFFVLTLLLTAVAIRTFRRPERAGSRRAMRETASDEGDGVR